MILNYIDYFADLLGGDKIYKSRKGEFTYIYIPLHRCVRMNSPEYGAKFLQFRVFPDGGRDDDKCSISFVLMSLGISPNLNDSFSC